MNWLFADATNLAMSLAKTPRTALVLQHLQAEKPLEMIFNSLHHIVFWLSISGIALAWFVYIKKPYLTSFFAK